MALVTYRQGLGSSVLKVFDLCKSGLTFRGIAHCPCLSAANGAGLFISLVSVHAGLGAHYIHAASVNISAGLAENKIVGKAVIDAFFSVFPFLFGENSRSYFIIHGFPLSKLAVYLAAVIMLV